MNIKNISSSYYTIGTLFIIITLLIVIILKKNNKEGFELYKFQKYGFVDKNTKYDLNGIDYGTLLGRLNPKTKRLPGAGTLSWESDTVLKNDKLMPIMNLLYSRACGPQLISKMAGYSIYKNQNELVVDEM